MKKISAVLISAFFLSMIPSNRAIAQNAKGQSSLNAGVGMSLVGLLFSTLKNEVNKQPGASITLSSTPAILGSYDYSLADHFSLGAAVSYQSFSSSYTNYTYTNSQGNSVTGTYKDKLTRLNIGMRPLFHFGNDENFDPYFGVRISYTQWSFSTTNPDPYYNTSNTYDFFGNPIKFQVLFGLHYFFGDLVGLNTELAFGPSYYLMGGLSFRFGGIGGGGGSKSSK